MAINGVILFNDVELTFENVEKMFDAFSLGIFLSWFVWLPRK